MEQMTALMDKMYIKLDQKDVPYKPQYIQKKRKRSEIGETLDRITTWR